MTFCSSYTPPPAENAGPAWWFFFRDGELIVRIIADGLAMVPRIADPASMVPRPVHTHFLGTLDGVGCYAAQLDKQEAALPPGMTSVPLRSLFDMVPDELFRIAGRASEIIHWDNTSRFCGSCGKPTRLSEVERAKGCTACGLTVYPRISPAVIVAVVRDRRLLLAHSGRFPQRWYSVLAGFVEPGESLEECVKREVKEEVDIDVSDVRYFGNQPWPFPDVMMVGFTARYAGGEIRVDGKEVLDAKWCSARDLAGIDLPGKVSISRKLIDWFAEEYKGK
jgi:NAD+ diphosphatase